MRKALAFDEAAGWVNRGVGELARRAVRDARGQCVGHRHLEDEHCGLAIDSVGLLQIVGGDSTHSDSLGRRVANGDGPVRAHGHVVAAIGALCADGISPQAGAIGRPVLDDDHIITGRYDIVLRNGIKLDGG